MFRLFQFIYATRNTLVFVLLEIICVALIASNNSYNGARLAGTSNYFFGSILSGVAHVKEYLGLRETNAALAFENARLKNLLQKYDHRPTDSTHHLVLKFLEARMINNSILNEKNYFTIDKGEASGIHPGMGVISRLGVVGKIKYASPHFAVGVSLLHVNNQVSCMLKRGSNVGTLQWDGQDIRIVKLKYIPRHVTPVVGDTIVTSFYNAVFPPGLPVGTVHRAELKTDASFYDIDVALFNDFTKLHYVDVVINPLKKEKDSVEQIIQRK